MSYKEWNHDEAEKMNKPLNIAEIESLIKIFSSKFPGRDVFPEVFSISFSVQIFVEIFIFFLPSIFPH